MELNSLYDIAEKENIKIYDWQIEDVDGIYLNYHNINAPESITIKKNHKRQYNHKPIQ